MLAVLQLDFTGQGVPSKSNVLFRTPTPCGYLKHTPNGCVLVTLKRSWGPSRNVALDYSRAQEQDNSVCLTMKSVGPYQSSLLRSTKRFGFFHCCFQSSHSANLMANLKGKRMTVFTLLRYISPFSFTQQNQKSMCILEVRKTLWY